MATRYCSSCGTKIEDGSAFCPGCGAPAAAGAGTAPAAAPPQAAPYHAPQPAYAAPAHHPGSPNRLPLIIGGVVLLLLAVGAWLVLQGGLGGEDYTKRGLKGFDPESAAATDSAAIIGRWTRSADCSRVLQFNADGTLVNPTGQPGTWVIQDQGRQASTIHITGGGHQTEAWLFRNGNDQYNMAPVDQRMADQAVFLTRCP